MLAHILYANLQLLSSTAGNCKEVAMYKYRVFWGVASIAMIIALVLAVLPGINVAAASDRDKDLKKEWEAAVDAYYAQESTHPKAHKMAENWLKANKDASQTDKNHVLRHLEICNASLSTGYWFVYNHPGFDSSYNVTDRQLARDSIKQLRAYINQHAGSVRSIKQHTNE